MGRPVEPSGDGIIDFLDLMMLVDNWLVVE
jgi:hypothetical protein